MPKGVKYGKWLEEMMDQALCAIRNGDLGLNKAARQSDILKAIPKDIKMVKMWKRKLLTVLVTFH
jgi:hypothetical protein